MNALDILKQRNGAFAKDFANGDMAPLPRLGTLILTCIDARVDPAHVLGLALGDAVVFRNNGGRVTPGFVDEVTALGALVTRLTGQEQAAFTIVLMQHTNCGARAFADPEFRALLHSRMQIDVSANAVGDQHRDLHEDIRRLQEAPHLPGTVSVAAVIYDVETGILHDVAPVRTLEDLRAAGSRPASVRQKRRAATHRG